MARPGVEPHLKWNMMHLSLKIRHLVATISLIFVRINCANAVHARKHFPWFFLFSLTTMKLPDFSRFSMRVTTPPTAMNFLYISCIYFLLPSEATMKLFSAITNFLVNTISDELLRLAWWNVDNFQRPIADQSRFWWFLCLALRPWAVLSNEQSLTVYFIT